MIKKIAHYINHNRVEALSLCTLITVVLFWKYSIDEPNKIEATAFENTLPHFYAGLTVVLVALIFVFYKFKSKNFELEKKENILLSEALALNMSYTHKLKSLNRMNDYLKNDINLPDIAKDFFNGSISMSDSASGMLYLNQMQKSDPGYLNIFKMTADLTKLIRSDTVSIDQIIQNFSNRTISKKMAGSNLIFNSFFTCKDNFSDWVFIRLDPYKKNWFGLLFLGRFDQKLYTDLDLEIIESLVSQFTIHVENFELSAKIDEANLIKSAFLSNMNHEIRTPLNAIIGYSEILEKSDSALEKRNLIKSIKKNSAQLSTLIDNMLDIAKIEFGQISIQNAPCSIQNLIMNISESAKSRCNEKGLDFIIQTELNSFDSVLIDEQRIGQILMNLIGNAIKFTDKGSVILKIVAEKKYDRDLILKFSVIDHGIGISAESQMDLFQNFSQSDNSLTRKYGGLGVGLALARRLAHALGGEVTLIESQINGGSNFLFEMPCQVSQIIMPIYQNILNTEEKITQAKDFSHLARQKILIVEDVVDNQEIFKYFLNSVGAIVDIVDNGQDAIDSAKEKEYDLILMDIQIPIINGLEATRQILKNGYTGPIIALTAHSSIDDRLNCMKAGCIEIITKPVTQYTLTTQIQKILQDQYEKL